MKLISGLKSFWRHASTSEQFKISKLATSSHCAIDMMFIYKLTEVKFGRLLRKYHDVTLAENDAAVYKSCL